MDSIDGYSRRQPEIRSYSTDQLQYNVNIHLIYSLKQPSVVHDSKHYVDREPLTIHASDSCFQVSFTSKCLPDKIQNLGIDVIELKGEVGIAEGEVHKPEDNVSKPGGEVGKSKGAHSGNGDTGLQSQLQQSKQNEDNFGYNLGVTELSGFSDKLVSIEAEINWRIDAVTPKSNFDVLSFAESNASEDYGSANQNKDAKLGENNKEMLGSWNYIVAKSTKTETQDAAFKMNYLMYDASEHVKDTRGITAQIERDDQPLKTVPESLEQVKCDLSKLLEGWEISPKRVLNMTILAKKTGHTDIRDHCDEYVKENLDIISKMKSTLSLPLPHLIQYFACSALPSSLKHDFVTERWKGFFNCAMPADDSLASKLRVVPIVLIMREITHLEKELPSIVSSATDLLTCIISVKNCFAFAILAEALDNDGMKAKVDIFFSQHVTDIISDETFISLRKSDLLKILRACSISSSIKAILAISLIFTSCGKTVPPAEMFSVGQSPDSLQDSRNEHEVNVITVPPDNNLYLILDYLDFFRQARKLSFAFNDDGLILETDEEKCLNKSNKEKAKQVEHIILDKVLAGFLSKNNQENGKQAEHIIVNGVSELGQIMAFKPDFSNSNESKEQFFKGKISAFNCFRIAISANEFGNEDLKNDIDRFLIRNFSSLVETDSAIFEGQNFVVLLEYLERTSIPEALRGCLILDLYSKLSKEQFPTMNDEQFLHFSESCRSFICGVFDLDEKSNQREYCLSEEGILQWEFSLLRKKKAEKTFNVGPDGGVVELHGCCLQFPEDALEKETQLTISVDSNPDNFPKDGCAIAPIFGVRPSVRFAKPVIVKIRTWIRTFEGKTKFATLFSREGDSDWEEIKQVRLKSTNEVEFSVRRFSDNVVMDVDAPESESSSIFTVKNSVYIQCHTGMIQSNFYRWEKEEHDVHALMRQRNCSVFTTQFMSFEGMPEDVVTVKVKLTEPNEREVLENAWRPSNSVAIKDVQKSGLFTIQAKSSPPSANGLVGGDYEVFLGENRMVSAFLMREWPVTLDPEVRRDTVNNNTYNISAVNYAHGNAPITHTTSASDVRVEANM